jgi:hypothetical protein
LKGVKYDFIGMTKRNREYKLTTIREAAKGMVESLECI